MKAIIFLFLSILCVPAFAGLQRLTLSEALRAKVVRVEATGNGGHQGRSLKLKVINNSGNPIQLTIDQGVIFRPADTSKQDLVTSGMELLALQPFKDGTTDVQTFCAKSYGGNPGQNLSFTFLRTGSDTLVKVLAYLKQNFLLDRAIGQNAVWVITNNHSLEAIYDNGNDLITTKLLDFMISVTGKKRPEVFKQYATGNAPDQPVFIPKALKIFARMEQILEEPAKLTLGVYDAQGSMIQKVFQDQQFAGKKGHRFRVEFEAANVAAGMYYIRLKKGDEVLQEKSVAVE